jgi:hypothetical protein
MKFLVTGCSFTKGYGLDHEKDDPLLWVNQLIRSRYPTAEIVNKSETGADNKTIFQNTCQELITNHYDFTLVGWTELSRHCYNFGLELYHTRARLNAAHHHDIDININSNITITSKDISRVGEFLMKYYNDHWSILDLVVYSNVLIKLTNGHVCFVNALADIGENFFKKKIVKLPSELSKFERNILSVDTRNDHEIFDLYNKIHNDYKKSGGIQEKYWLNLYNSLKQMKVDNISEFDEHPGYKSQNIYFNKLHSKFNEKISAS